MSKHITVALEKCMGCHTCELACAIAHSESGNIEIMAIRGEKPGYRLNVETFKGYPVPVNCQHCDDPACVHACPTDAVSRLADGKPVLVDEARCIGCSMCVQACPFGMMTMKENGRSAMKCDLCVRRLAVGDQPACVASCPTSALFYEEEETQNKAKRIQAAERLVSAQEKAEVQEIR